jgi:UDPglucose 6-dehydrogenase
MIGLGKLGTPVACAMVQKGHKVFGYDINEDLRSRLRSANVLYYEPNINKIMNDCLHNGLTICETVNSAVRSADIIFVAVPTPSNEDNSFDTSYVHAALREIAQAMNKVDRYQVVSIISTVLPGTTRQEFLQTLGNELDQVPDEGWGLCYNAQFIAMGTTIEDMLNPEFVLIGEYDERSGDVLAAFYSQLVDAPLLRMSIESAETVKMAYNTMIGFKIVYANTLMELCDKVAFADCDEVYGALSKANKRLLSPRYLRGGLGDGGGCHPRDNRALSWQAEKLGLSANPFEFVMAARDAQSRALAQIVLRVCQQHDLPLAIMGLTFKPETNLTLDSPSLLLIDHLLEIYLQPTYEYDPIIKPEPLPAKPKIYVLATCHEEFKNYPYEWGSVIIDPWRMIDDIPDGVAYRGIGL